MSSGSEEYCATDKIQMLDSLRRFDMYNDGSLLNVFVAAPTPAIRSPIDILMVTTMALVWTVNSTLSWGVIT